MIRIDLSALQNRIEKVFPMLHEYQRRRSLATEAKSIGYGGVSIVSRLSGLSRQRLTVGVKELSRPEAVLPELGQRRKSGAGRPSVWKLCPEILEVLN
ncbi:MAG: hypothetical protein LBF88_09835 [Planctomycetaceae bacterium]|jgi:hypothetical protein|nr:hypothetical protein [Planctomycetaceae bacterium]